MTPEDIKSGGYTPKNVKKSGKHGDARLKKYRDDQLSGREAREQRLELSLQAFLNRKRREWDVLLAPVHDAMAFVKDIEGRDLSTAGVDARRQELVATRGRYKRKDGAWAALRSQRVVVGPDGKTLRNEKNKPVLERVAQEDTKVILHEAFELDPRLSLALTHAAKASPQGGAWKQFLEATAPDVADLVEQHIGARPELVPYHPKALEGHFQPEFCIVDAEGNKRPVRQRVHLGPAMIGAARWRGMGIKGAELDALTGIKDSDAGLDYVLKSRGERANGDWLVLRDLDKITMARLKEPQFAVLLPFWEQGCKEYAEYLEERRQVVGAEVAAKRLKEAEAEVEEVRRAKQKLFDDAQAALNTLGAKANARIKEEAQKAADAKARMKVAEETASVAAATAKALAEKAAAVEAKLAESQATIAALCAENEALKVGPRIEVDGTFWTIAETGDAVDRLAVGKGRGKDEFLLGESGLLRPTVKRQLEALRQDLNEQIVELAEVALSACDDFDVRRRAQRNVDIETEVRRTTCPDATP